MFGPYSWVNFQKGSCGIAYFHLGVTILSESDKKAWWLVPKVFRFEALVASYFQLSLFLTESKQSR